MARIRSKDGLLCAHGGCREGAGRARVTGSRRSRSVSVHMRVALLNQVERRAAEVGMSRSEWIRSALVAVLRKCPLVRCSFRAGGDECRAARRV